ncbi:MAG: ATP-binding protein [Desulfobacterales bacterium]|nr:ATP-binding protein [Desulfobacterales bacterium]
MILNKLFPHLKSDISLVNQLSVRLVRNVISVAVPLGIAFIFGQMLLDFSSHKENLDNTATQVFNIVEKAATHIVWTLDKNGGQSFVTGILEHDPIVSVALVNDKGKLFAKAEKEALQPASLVSRFLFGGHRVYALPLTRQISSHVNLPIGELKLTLDPQAAVDRLVNRFTSIMIFGLLLTFFMAGVLLSVFHFYLVQPLQMASNSLYQISPRRIGAERIHLPHRHREDELGRFIQKTNELLAAVEENISSRERAETEVRLLNKELEAKVLERTKELEAFTYSVTHDLRTSVRSIEGFSNALLEDCSADLDQTGKTYLGFLEDAGRQMNDHIDALLELSKTTSGGITREDINLSAMSRQVCDGLARLFEKNPPELHIPDGITGHADRRLVAVVLKNLFENAFKYTSRQSEPRIELGKMDLEGKPTFFIKDNGAGFDMSNADKLFLPFRRIHRRDDFAGTGIGLATVERIILRHNGKIWAESAIGEGAVFFFTLG